MDMNKLRRELDSIKGGMEDINSLLVETENTSKDMVQRLADLSSIANKGGIVRSIVTRASAGIPGVYQLMQQLSSMLLVFKYLVVARNADLKAEQEMIESLKKREQLQRRLYNLGQSLDKDKKGKLTALEKEKFYNDASIKHLMRTMSLTEALALTQKRFRGVQETARKADSKILSKSRRQYVKDNFRGQSYFNRVPMMGGTPTSGQSMFGGHLEAKAGIMMADKEVETLTKRRIGMVGERNETKRQYGKTLTKLNRAGNEKERRLLKRQLDMMEEELRVRNDRIESIKEDLSIAREDRDSQIGAGKGKFTTKGSGKGRTFTDLGFFEKKQLQFQKFKEGIDRKMTSVRKGLSTFFSKGNIGLMLNTLKATFAFMGYALLAILGIGLIVYTMKKTGIWDKIADFVKNKWPEFRYFFEVMWEGIKMMASGFWDYISGIWKIIKGLYTGDNTLISKGLGLILEGAGKMLGGALVFIGSLAGLVFKMAITSIGVYVGLILGGLEKIWNKASKPIKGALVGAGAAALVIGGLALTGTGIGAGPGLAMVAAGATMGAGIGSQMVSGGTVLGGGNFLVGENGPELVTLPGGTSVTNNTNTRSSLGPTINVHVNGRVGASDQELNEIARKIGNKINIEMNRFNSRGYRA